MSRVRQSKEDGKGAVIEMGGGRPTALVDIVNILENNLAIDGSMTDVLDQSCRQLGVSDSGPLVDRANKCYDMLFKSSSPSQPCVTSPVASCTDTTLINSHSNLRSTGSNSAPVAPSTAPVAPSTVAPVAPSTVPVAPPTAPVAPSSTAGFATLQDPNFPTALAKMKEVMSRHSNFGPRPGQRKVLAHFEYQKDIYPLHYAAMVGDTEKVQALLAAGANPNLSLHPAERWCEPLSWAAALNQVHVIVALIEGGADPRTSRNGKGVTPSGDAHREKHKAATEMLDSFDTTWPVVRERPGTRKITRRYGVPLVDTRAMTRGPITKSVAAAVITTRKRITIVT